MCNVQPQPPQKNVQRCSGDMRRTLCTLHRLHVLQYVLCMRMLRYVACAVRVVQFRHARTARVICPRNHFATLPIYVAPSICASLPSVQVCYLLCPWAQAQKLQTWAPLKGPLHIVTLPAILVVMTRASLGVERK